jgi:hypothetical protein
VSCENIVGIADGAEEHEDAEEGAFARDWKEWKG